MHPSDGQFHLLPLCLEHSTPCSLSLLIISVTNVTDPLTFPRSHFLSTSHTSHSANLCSTPVVDPITLLHRKCCLIPLPSRFPPVVLPREQHLTSSFSSSMPLLRQLLRTSVHLLRVPRRPASSDLFDLRQAAHVALFNCFSSSTRPTVLLNARQLRFKLLQSYYLRCASCSARLAASHPHLLSDSDLVFVDTHHPHLVTAFWQSQPSHLSFHLLSALLCVSTPRYQLRAWPPSASRFLYPTHDWSHLRHPPSLHPLGLNPTLLGYIGGSQHHIRASLTHLPLPASRFLTAARCRCAASAPTTFPHHAL